MTIHQSAALRAKSRLRAEVFVRRALSMHMLQAACTAAQRIEHAEATASGNKSRDIAYAGHDVPVAIVMALTALEAWGNEIVADFTAQPGSHRLPGGAAISAARIELLDDFLRAKAGGASERFKQIALLLDQKPRTDLKCWKELKLLQNLRNSLVHYKPKWKPEHSLEQTSRQQELEVFREIEKVIGGRARGYNPVLADYPHALFTAGCARWAIGTTRKFAAHFAMEMKMRNPFEDYAASASAPRASHSSGT